MIFHSTLANFYTLVLAAPGAAAAAAAAGESFFNVLLVFSVYLFNLIVAI